VSRWNFNQALYVWEKYLTAFKLRTQSFPLSTLLSYSQSLTTITWLLHNGLYSSLTLKWILCVGEVVSKIKPPGLMIGYNNIKYRAPPPLCQSIMPNGDIIGTSETLAQKHNNHSQSRKPIPCPKACVHAHTHTVSIYPTPSNWGQRCHSWLN
jgi:hypothetical protein